MLKFLYFIYLSLIIFFVSGGNAYAYLDPGTGSIIITAIIAFFAVISTKISIYWQKIKNLFKKNKDTDKNDN